MISVDYQIPSVNILVTGTPGVGKTTLCRLLKAHINDKIESIEQLKQSSKPFQFIELANQIKKQKLYTSWNKEFDVPQFDQDMVCDYLDPIMDEKRKIVQFHSSGFFPERYFDFIVLLRTDNTTLYDRLEKRGYNQNKITENIECQIFDVTKDQVYESYQSDKILELKSQKIEDVEKNIESIMKKVISM